MIVKDNGVANSTLIETWGNVTVVSHGLASNTILNGGRLTVESCGGAVDNTINNYGVISAYGRSASVAWTKIEGGLLSIKDQAIAYTTIVNSFGRIYVESDGKIQNTTVNSAGSVFISSGGTATSTTVNSWGYLEVCSGGTANNTIINNGYLMVSSGGVAYATVVNDGGKLSLVQGGMAKNTVLHSKGTLMNSGGVISGSIQIDTGALVTVNTAAVIDFTVSEQISPFTALINNWSLINNGNDASYTITVKTDQAYDTYALANEAAAFTKSITVKNTENTELVTISVGETKQSGLVRYSLSLSGKQLQLGVSEGEKNVKLFSSGTLVSAACMMTGETIVSGGQLQVSSGGVADNTTVNTGGDLNVSSGGVADNTTVNTGGQLQVSSGGKASSTTVNTWGYLIIYSGGVANDTLLNDAFGYLLVENGGTANSTMISSGGKIWVNSGGAVNSTTINYSGLLRVYSGGVANHTTINYGDLEVFSGGTVNNTIINNGYLKVYSGVTADNTSVNSGGHISVSSGGVANHTTVNSGGKIILSSGGTALQIKENGGYVEVDPEAIVSFIANSFSGLKLYDKATLHSGTTAIDTTVNTGGKLQVSSGGVISGSLQIASRAVVSAYQGAVIDFSVAEQQVSRPLINRWDLISGRTDANYTITVNSDQTEKIYILAAGASDFAQTITVKNTEGTVYGTLGVDETKEFSGTRYKLSKDSDCLTLSIGDNPRGIEVKVYSRGSLVSAAAVMTGENIRGFGGNDSMFISSGGMANSTTVSWEGNLYVSSGGTASNTFVDSRGTLHVSSGGTANNTTIHSPGVLYGPSDGGTVYISGGVVNNTTVNSRGTLHISSGGTANSTTVNSWGSMYVSSGGTANSTTVNGGYLTVEDGGTANSTTVNSNGYLHISGGVAHHTILNAYCRMYVYSEGTADSTTVNSNSDLYISSGGAVNNTIINGGLLTVSSGVTADNTTVNSDGRIFVSSGGAVNRTTINSSSYLYISSGGVANDTILNAYCSMYVCSGGTADSTTVNSSGFLTVSSGGTALQIKENGGYVRVDPETEVSFIANSFSGLSLGGFRNATLHSGTTANSTTLDGGRMFVFSGGMANDTTVNSSGFLTVSSGGVAKSTTVNGGYLTVEDGGALSGTLQIANGANVYVWRGGIIDFTVAEQTSSSMALINNWSLIGGREDASYTITVNENQNTGTYILANGAADFDKTVTFKFGEEEIGTLSVGNTMKYGKKDYTLNKEGSVLSLAVVENTITITAKSGSQMYDGTAFSLNDFTYTGTIAAGDELFVTVTGSITDAGTADNVVSNYKVMRGKEDVTKNYTFNASVKGTLTVTKRNVTLTSNSSSQKYDGTELEGTVTVGGAGFVSGEATASASSITDAGTITNTITVNEGAGYKASNYNIIKNEGTLTVTKRNVTLTSASDVKNYDGTPLTNHNVTVTGDGFVGEESYTVNVTGSQTEIGESKNTFTYKLTDGAKTQNYDVTKVEGTLEVTKDAVPITITAKSGSQMYDGTAFSLNDFTYTGTIAAGDELFVTVTGSITDAGTADNVVSNYKVMRGKEDVTKNYTFNESVKGTLEVTKRDVTLTSNSDSRKYNGDVLEGTVTVGGDGFVAGEATASASSITDAGTITNTITVNASTGYKESNYNITKNEGTLTVTKRQVTLTSASDSKVYDGTALTNHNISVSGDGFVSGEGYTANVTGSQTAVGSSKNTFTYELTNGATTQNYDVIKVEGTLTVKEGSEPTPVKSLVVDSDMTLTADSSYSSITVKEDAKLTVDASITTAKLTVAGSEVAVTGAGSLDVSGTATISGTSTLTGILDAESVTIYTKADVEAATLNTGKVTVNTGAKLVVTDAINGSDDADAVKLGSNAVLTAGAIDLDEGSNTVTVGSKASVTVGTISGVSKLTLSSNAKMDVTEYTGTAAKDTMSIGSGATFEAGKVDLGDAANAITVSGKADVKISELEGSLNKLSLSSGTSGDLTIFAADKIFGTDAADNLSIGSYADVKIGSDISLGSGNDTVKIGSNSTFTAKDIELGDGTNSMTVGSNSTATVASISDVSKLTLSSKATLTVTDAYTGTEAKDTMSIGSGATFEAGKVDLGDGANTITVSGKADVKIGELEGSLNKLTLSSGTESDLTTFATNTVNGTEAADKLSIGNYADVKISCAIELAEGNDTVAVGKFSKFAAGTIDFGEGTGDKFTAGYQTDVKLEAVTGLNQFVTQYGTEDRLTKVDVAGDIQFSADATTTGNKLTIAKYTDMNVHGLIDFNDAKNTIVVGNDSTVVLKAEDAAKVAKFTIGTGAEAYLSSELAAQVSSNKGTVYDIGTADVAVNFSSAADEISDNHLTDARDLADSYDGWLNNDIDSVDYLKTGTEDMTVSFGKDYTNFEVKTGANWTAVTSEILAVSADTQFGIRLASDVKGSFAYTVKN